MVQAQIRYLHEVGGQLYYRRRVPDDLKPVLGRSEWKHALGLSRGQEHHAARITAEYDVAYARLIARERINRLTVLQLRRPSGGIRLVGSRGLQHRRSKLRPRALPRSPCLKPTPTTLKPMAAVGTRRSRRLPSQV